MFTGIVEALGTVRRLDDHGRDTRRLLIDTALDLSGLSAGASVAVDGACLTAVEKPSKRRRVWTLAADLGPETQAKTTLGDRRPGDRVHLERPLRLGDALGGHLVTGHVDGIGRIASVKARGAARELWIEVPAALGLHVVTKGSIAVDGVSLTVNDARARTLSVTLIPHTLAVTLLGARPPGCHVNIETDLLAKHVARLVRQFLPRAAATRDRVKRARKPAPR